MNPINLALRFLLEVTALVVVHYAWSYERVAWLLRQ
jgi:hypothetical protein